MGKILKNMYSSVISVLFFMITLSLFVINIFNTCYTKASRSEDNFFVKDSPVINILLIILMLGIVVFSIRKNYFDRFSDDKVYKKARRIILLIIGSMGLIWVLGTRINPDFDQLYVQDAVYGLWWKNYSAFAPGGYIDLYLNQVGMVVISFVFSFLFGNYNFLAFQITNALVVPFIYDEMSKISAHFGFGNKERTLILLSGILFVPLIVYSGFVYGTIIGLYFAVLSIRLMMDYLNLDKKIIYPVSSVIFMGLSIAFKSNYLIFSIALGIYILIKCFSKEKAKKLLWIVALLASVAIFSEAPLMVLRGATKEKLDQGATTYSWMVMGLSESMSDAAGIYTGYNEDTYRQSGFNSDIQKEMALNEYKKLLSETLTDPIYSLDYFLRKETHQWSDPSFKAFWNLESLYVDSNISPWAQWVLRPDVNYYLTLPVNYMQSAVFMGAFLYIALCRKKEGFIESLVLPMTFVGGFIFQTIWEAKSQYTISFYVLLFPVSIVGILEFAKLINSWISKKPQAIKLRKDYKWNMGFTLAFVSLLMLGLWSVLLSSGIFAGIFRGTDNFKKYLQTQDMAVSDGTYSIISDFDGKSLYKEGASFDIKYQNGKARIALSSEDIYITANEITDPDTSNAILNYFKSNQTQEFDIILEDGYYYIVYEGKYALTKAKDGSSFFVELINHPQQRWLIK